MLKMEEMCPLDFVVSTTIIGLFLFHDSRDQKCGKILCTCHWVLKKRSLVSFP